MPDQEKKHPSLHTLFIFIGIGIAILLLGFIGMTGYYAWQIKFGSAETNEALSTSLSLAPSRTVVPHNLTAIQDWRSLIRSHNPTVGSVDAPITIIAFIDFECPFCQAAYPTFAEITERYAPVVRIVFKHYPIEALHPTSRRVSLAATCAEDQDAFWPYYEQLFLQRAFDDTALVSYATTLGLDTTTFRSCLESGMTQSYITADLTDGASIGVQGTPTYIINGIKYEGSFTREQWNTLLLPLLQQ